MAEAFRFIESPDTKAGSQKPQCPCHQYITDQILGTEIFELSKPGLCMT